MIDSLFIISSTGHFVMEKHFQNPVPRSVCEPFLEYLETIRNNCRPADAKKRSIARQDSTAAGPGGKSKRRGRRFHPRIEQKIVGNLHQVPKIIPGASPKTALVHICRDRLVYLAVVTKEAPPLLVLECLSSVHRVLARYCCPIVQTEGGTSLTEDVLRQNFSTACLLLDEVVWGWNLEWPGRSRSLCFMFQRREIAKNAQIQKE